MVTDTSRASSPMWLLVSSVNAQGILSVFNARPYAMQKKCPEAYILQSFEGTRNNYDQTTRIAKGALLSGLFPASLANAFSPKEPLKVSAFGGFFQKAFESSICQKFTEETGTPVTTFSQGQGDDWLFPLIRAVRGGSCPMDVTILMK